MGSMMIWARRRTRWWVAIVLPGLLLRALIPIGFMPAFAPGMAVGLMLCEGYAPVAPGTAAMDMPSGMPSGGAMDMSMEMPSPGNAADSAQHGHSGGGSHDHSSCPYGASPASASGATWASVSVRLQSLPQPALAAPQIRHVEIAPRAQSPRAPPVAT